MDAMIACPSCGHRFEMGPAIREHLEAELRQRLEEDTRRRISKAIEDSQRDGAEEFRRKDADLADAQKRLRSAGERETDLLRREREIGERQDQIQLEIERRLADESRRIREEVTRTADDRLALRIQEEVRQRDEELVATRQRLDEAVGKEAAVTRRERELKDREGRLQLELEGRLAHETDRIRKEAEAAAAERHARQVADENRQREQELAAARERLEAAATKEAALLRRQAELEDQTRNLPVELERRLLVERKNIHEQSEKKATERLDLERQQQLLQDRERREQIDGLKRNVADLQRRLDQGSQQLQGEAQEVELREVLTTAFPRDTIEDVGKGAQGADLVHRVRDEEGRECGIIVWESKRTKSWSDEWLVKLRDDQRAIGGGCAVVVSQALPPGLGTFGCRDGVWICSWGHAVGVGAVLRAGVIELAGARRAAEGRGEKMQILYDYLTGPEFRNRIGGVVEAFVEMRDDLETERRSIMGQWRKREKQLDRALENLTSFHGDLRGIAGRQLAELPELALPPAMSYPDFPVAAQDADPGDGSGQGGQFSAPIDDTLVELLFSLIPDNYSSIGNKSLADLFSNMTSSRLGRRTGEDDYARCKAVLLEQGRIRKGMGRGGSVARMELVSSVPRVRAVVGDGE